MRKRTLYVRREDYLPHQYDFLCCEKEIVSLVGGLGCGKTYAFLKMALKNHIFRKKKKDNKSNGWIIYPTLSLAEELFVEDFHNLLFKLKIPFIFKNRNMTFHSNYGQIKIYTLERPERMIGSNLTFAGIDEFDTVGFDRAMRSYKKIIGRLRGCSNPQLFIVATPEGFGATYKIFVEDFNDKKAIFHGKTTDNHHLPSSYVELMKSEYDERMLKAYMNGQFVNLFSGSVYYTFDQEKHINDQVEMNVNMPVNICFDFNVYPFSVVMTQHKNRNDIWVFDEVVMKTHCDTYTACEAIKQKLPRHIDVVVYGDASGAFHSTKSLLSDYQIIKNSFRNYFRSLNFRIQKRNPAIRDRVNCVNSRFKNDAVAINPRCVKLIKDLEQVTYAENGNIDESNKQLVHVSSAFGYYIWAEFPILDFRNNIKTRSL
jgi:hypothetical protein